MRHLAFDLELEQPNSNPQTPDSLQSEAKIIQLGWVIYEPKKGEPKFLAKEVRNIKIKTPISAFIKKLTGITDADIENGITIEEAVSELKKSASKFEVSKIAKQWGSGDDWALNREVGFAVFKGAALNVKHLYSVYAEANNLKFQGGLETVIKDRLKLPNGFEGRPHNALIDATNTARVHNFLLNEFKKGCNK